MTIIDTKNAPGAEWVVGRNPVFEALDAGLPAKAIYLAEGVERDSRVTDILRLSAEKGVPLLQASRHEVDKLTNGAVHQGVALQLPEFEYADAEDILDDALAAEAGLVVALDQVTDPRNLGAIIRSAVAFGAHGVLLPERRTVHMTAAAWKTSAGAAARLPIAMATNLNRALEQASKMGFTIIGLAGEGEVPVSGAPGVDGPLVIVVGSEDEGLARLVREHCDALVSIPIASGIESLNASVAAAVALYEVSQQRSGMTPSE